MVCHKARRFSVGLSADSGSATSFNWWNLDPHITLEPASAGLLELSSDILIDSGAFQAIGYCAGSMERFLFPDVTQHPMKTRTDMAKAALFKSWLKPAQVE